MQAIPSGLARFFQYVNSTGAAQPNDVSQPHFCPFNLAATCFAAQVRADAMLSLTEIAEDAQKQVRSRDSGWRAHGLLIERLIQGVMASDRPLQVAPVKVPPGSPI